MKYRYRITETNTYAFPFVIESRLDNILGLIVGWGIAHTSHVCRSIEEAKDKYNQLINEVIS